MSREIKDLETEISYLDGGTEQQTRKMGDLVEKALCLIKQLLKDNESQLLKQTQAPGYVHAEQRESRTDSLSLKISSLMDSLQLKADSELEILETQYKYLFSKSLKDPQIINRMKHLLYSSMTLLWRLHKGLDAESSETTVKELEEGNRLSSQCDTHPYQSKPTLPQNVWKEVVKFKNQISGMQNKEMSRLHADAVFLIDLLTDLYVRGMLDEKTQDKLKEQSNANFPVQIQSEISSEKKTTKKYSEDPEASSGPHQRPMSARRLHPRHDSRHAENINEQCRPSVISTRYRLLESREREDAYQYLEQHTKTKQDSAKFLCNTIMGMYRISKDIYNSLEVVIAACIYNPALAVDIVKRNSLLKETKLPDEMRDVICKCLRQACERFDARALIKMWQPPTGHYVMESEKMKIYLDKSAHLTWEMVIQQPPMILSVEDQLYDETRHELWYECKKKPNMKIRHFLWPVLLECEGGNMVGKGHVFTE